MVDRTHRRLVIRRIIVVSILGVFFPVAAFAQSQVNPGPSGGGGQAKHGGGKPPQQKPSHPHHKPSQPQHKSSHPHHKPSPPHHKPSQQPRYGTPPRSGQFYHHGHWYGRVHGPVYVYPSGWHYRRWPIGGHLPAVFLVPTYFYPDYVGLGLPPPPPGFNWVRYGPDLLLVNVRTGIVDDVVYGAFY
jgi:Ni/Co efflux regulator RcnB